MSFEVEKKHPEHNPDICKRLVQGSAVAAPIWKGRGGFLARGTALFRDQDRGPGHLQCWCRIWTLFPPPGFVSSISAATTCFLSSWYKWHGSPDISLWLVEQLLPCCCSSALSPALQGATIGWGQSSLSCSMGGEGNPCQSPWNYPQAAVLPSVLDE